MTTNPPALAEKSLNRSLTYWQKLWRCIKERRLPVRVKRFVPDMLGKLTKQDVVYCKGGYRKFLKFKLDDKSMADLILDEIFNTQVYFPTITSRTKFEIKRGETVIDIGANIGLFATCAASLSRTGKIYCFEPSKDNFARLQYHRKHNGLENMVPVNQGISDKVETLKLYLVNDNCGAHSTVEQKEDSADENYEVIECVPLQQVFDEYAISRCHFLKIDCEGAELKILTALPADYFRRIDRIALEYHPNVDALELAELLHQHGFSVVIKGYPQTWGLIFAIRE